MALRWAEGFDIYGSKFVMEEGVWFYATGVSVAPVSTEARTGTHSLQIGAGAVSAEAKRSVGAPGNTFGIGFAWIYSESGNSGGIILSFLRGSNEHQVSIELVHDVPSDRFRVRALRGGVGGTELDVSAPVIDRLNWEHFEVRVFVHPTAGSVEVRHNEITILSVTGANTQELSDDTIELIQFGQGSFGFAKMHYDDVFLWDTSGGAVDDFQGDVKAYTRFPTNDTVVSDWTRNQGATDYENISEAAPDDDTSYIDAAAANDVSEFEFEDLPPEVVAVVGCQVYWRSRKDSSGTCNVQPGLVSGAQVALGTDRALSQSYAYQGPVEDVIENDPDTGAPWTPAALNAAKLRFTRTA